MTTIILRFLNLFFVSLHFFAYFTFCRFHPHILGLEFHCIPWYTFHKIKTIGGI